MTQTETPAEEPLAQLRAKLDQIDADLMKIAADRMAIVQAIGAVKAKHGAPVYDREREREVRQRSRRLAEDNNVSPALGEALIQTLLEASHDVQEQAVSTTEQSSEPRRFLIIGGGGQMGQLFSRALAERGHTIDILEANDKGDPTERVNRADVVMISVPMRYAAQIAQKIAPMMREDALLCDINSLKSGICQIYRDHCRCQAVGTHPMFGPTVHALRRQKVVVCPVNPGPLVDWFQRELALLGMELITATPETHDQMMAVVQVLVHFNTLVMGDALRRTGISVHDSLQYTSPIYRLELAFVGRLFTQDPDLYAEIEMQNPYSAQALTHYQEAVQHLQEVIREGDRDSFRSTFNELTGYFSDFGDESMELSDFVIDAIVARS